MCFLNKACFTVPELYICLEGCHAALDAFFERHHGVLWGQLNTGRTDGWDTLMCTQHTTYPKTV